MSDQRNAPLAGFTVVEHADRVAASYAGRMLAVMGATVIKVEAPGDGSALPSRPPDAICTLRAIGKSRRERRA